MGHYKCTSFEDLVENFNKEGVFQKLSGESIWMGQLNLAKHDSDGNLIEDEPDTKELPPNTPNSFFAYDALNWLKAEGHFNIKIITFDQLVKSCDLVEEKLDPTFTWRNRVTGFERVAFHYLGFIYRCFMGENHNLPEKRQFYFHKDRGLNDALLERARAANFNVMALTVDTITGGNRERDLRTGFTSPPKLNLSSLWSFATHPAWAWHFFTGEKFDMPHLSGHINEGTNVAVSVGDYFSTMLDPTMSWDDAEKLCAQWNGQFALKGIMSVEDAQRAVDIGCTGIMVSNHGGRQLDGSRAPFDQLEEICDAVGDKIDVICEGGIQRGTHVLKALSAGAKAVSGGRLYLYALAAAGQAGVERALGNFKTEIERDMRLMGVSRIDELGRGNLRRRGR